MSSRLGLPSSVSATVADLDWLRQGDTLTLTYVAQVDDGHGNVGAQNLVMVTGRRGLRLTVAVPGGGATEGRGG